MKKIISLVLLMSIFMSMSVCTFASTENFRITDSLTNRLLMQDIKSEQDFENVLKTYIKENSSNNRTYSENIKAMNFGKKNQQKINDKFTVQYDEQTGFITLIELQISSTDQDKVINISDLNTLSNFSKSSATYIKSGTATATSYSWVGMKIWTVTSEFQFQYTVGSSVFLISNTGYFNPAIFSLWTSSPWMDNPVFGGKSVASTYGTANLNLGLAQILGLTFNLDSVNYKLNVTCDKYGTLSTSYTAARP